MCSKKINKISEELKEEFINNYTLLHKKSIIYCDEKEELFHIQENDKILSKLYSFFDEKVVVEATRLDLRERGKTHTWGEMRLEEAVDLIQYYDIKNGVDFLIDDYGCLIVRTFGQGYTMGDDDIYHLIVWNIKIDNNNENSFNFKNLLLSSESNKLNIEFSFGMDM